MTRVLYVSSTLPWEPDDGERVRCHHLIAQLAERVDLTVACPVPAPDTDPPVAMRRAGWRFFVPDRDDAVTRLRSRIGLVPVFYTAARSQALLDWLRALQAGAFDAVHLDGLPALHYRDEARRIASRVVFDLRDCWSMLYSRRIASNPSLALWLKRIGVERLERRVVASPDPVTVVSPIDREHLRRRYGVDGATLHVVPNGVAEDLFDVPAFERPSGLPTVVFTGAFGYPPNEEAAVWFVERVMPTLRTRVPGLRLAIVGKDPSDRLRRHATIDVQVTGRVRSVVEWLARADVVVAPLRSGAGIKNKVLEALAAGRPTVASPIAVEGVAARSGRDLVIADAPDEWVDSICGLLDDPVRAARMAGCGRTVVRDSYAWDAAATSYVALYSLDGSAER